MLMLLFFYFLFVGLSASSLSSNSHQTSECKQTSLELVQTISVVFNPPIMFEGKQSWSLFKLFGTALKEECKLASSTKIYVDVSSNDTANPHTLQPEPSAYEKQTLLNGDYRKLALYDIKTVFANRYGVAKQLNVISQYKKDHTFWREQTPPLFATRFVSGYGVSQGGIVSRITNKLPKAIKIAYLDIIPWYLRIYLHTISITNQGVSIEPDVVYYKPAKDRSQPHQLELVLTLPAQSVTELRIDFDRSYLKWTEYPPDANHGVYVGSAVISVKLDVSTNVTKIPSQTTTPFETHQASSFYFIRIHTESLLVSLPTPDFSMPYNVICLVSTVVSLAFGPLHNLTTRRARIAIDDDTASTNFFSKLMCKLRRKKNIESEAQAEQSEESK